jgi:hypothetical protein
MPFTSIISIVIIFLFIPGYFGLYSPYIGGSYQNLPYWFNIIITCLCVFAAALIIKSFFYYLEINDVGITQKTIGARTIKWQDIQGWGYSSDAEGNYLFLELTSDKKKRELIHQSFLDKKNFSLLKIELEKRLGNANTATGKC